MLDLDLVFQITFCGFAILLEWPGSWNLLLSGTSLSLVWILLELS